MKRKRMFFLINDLLFEVLKPEITLKKIKVTEVKIENEEYKVIRRKYNEDIYLIEKSPDGWCIKKKV
jgi:hypothetical protein